ncbi:MAG TPA: hypothetical protein VHZ50_16400 [Puia sp.]|jgi:hypothetical protein|nr:hypothetical protein [Puia sp.]
MTNNAFFPRWRYITNISNEQYAVVTFLDSPDFLEDEIISFRVTRPYGMFEINEKRAKVLSVDDMTVTIDIDTTFFNPFIYPVVGANTPPVCVPVGSGINFDSAFAFTILNDAFDNLRI